MKIHELKTWPPLFRLIVTGAKPFEVRKNDRDFRVGDALVLREWQPDKEGRGGWYTGAETIARVTYVMKGPILGIIDGWVVMGISVPPARLADKD